MFSKHLRWAGYVALALLLAAGFPQVAAGWPPGMVWLGVGLGVLAGGASCILVGCTAMLDASRTGDERAYRVGSRMLLLGCAALALGLLAYAQGVMTR